MRTIPSLQQLGITAFAAVLLGCNNYEIFLVSGQEQASYSNVADVVFIADNSSSMTNEAEALALNFSHFINYLTDEDQGSNRSEEDISDAVTNYITYVSDRGRLLDYQLAITTSDVPGDAGSLVTTNGVDIIQKRDDNVAKQFNRSLLCNATCWDPLNNPIPNDPEYECNSEDPTIPEGVSYEFLDCVCGNDGWQSGAGCATSGDEEPLEAAFLAMCRAVENPPPDCFHEVYSPLTDADIGSNAGMIRDDSTVIFLIVSDEGDQSRRFEGQNPDPTVYLELLDQFNVRYRFAVIGPPYSCEIDAEGRENCQLICNSGGATTWGTERYQQAAQATGGFFNPIAEEGSGGTCQASEFSEHLEDLGKLLNSLLTAFPLQSVPDIGTIQVFVDNQQVQPSIEEDQPDGTTLYEGGWSYDSSTNSVVFHEPDIPDYHEAVRIYYRPLEGMPRTLPFEF
ncbi:MAG: hypothetical protein VX519_11050 [Myxococcota bacterium]|nr:hypothetical protein [Myxococcota bacterium]